MRWEILLILLVACSAPEVTTMDRPFSDDTQQPHSEVVILPQVQETPAETVAPLKTFEVEAFQFGYEPSTITVNEGDRVQITAWSRDVPHGLRIREFGLNMELRDKTPVTAEFVASKKGTFSYRCSIPCGHGHGGMEGTLIVQ